MEETNFKINQTLDSHKPNESTTPKFKYSINKNYILVLIAIVLLSFIAFVCYNLWNFGTVKIGVYYINAWQPPTNNEAYFHFGKSDREKAQSEFGGANLDKNIGRFEPTPTVMSDKLTEEQQLITLEQTYKEDEVLKIINNLKDMVSEKSVIENGNLNLPPLCSGNVGTREVLSSKFSVENIDYLERLSIVDYFKDNNYKDLCGEISNIGQSMMYFQKDNLFCEIYIDRHWQGGNASYLSVNCGLLNG